MDVILLILGVAALFLITQRWFWVLVFGLGTLASAFTVIASVIHFQILGAVGFTVLTFILWAITVMILGSD
ncbi:hypothetical protein O5O45_06835 [Hahella aquimaris]|uniref:hypothetical protein n=1 Tax=Hahella sp. HNIBRBA332 TaxID=3015983 RepID=UPI00273C7ED2|nr:hypothetical protein [Hahella sp. HNIBRBA332]WLQ15630.1 hypothetical protein O5O45_06835 [Hahella sp. HNIBRBA332]